ncbi:DsbA family oxidoreductase [Paenibacillus hexagrammi]|uniref:DsbA family oxidoreductase n=1 Tax=Paenibacillus hexagrammi TaxID=2908839 RepID=A0ABY3SJ34_9BACL|nr:DsbA family oxidoreductase [Paenibacillus sp. YPD9-1]UJF34049.1 DsbA family oxidoreductase [Paenibacillus sp. YPD9-1]
MLVEIWSDVMCPFCYIGKRRFEAGLRQFAHQEQVEVVYRSFELDPGAPRESEVDVHGMLAAKYGMSREEAIAMNEQVGSQAAEEGLTYRFDTMVLTNTFDAHRLIRFAASSGKSAEVAELLFRAYFTESRHIGDYSVLASIAEEAGLDRQAAAAMLESGQYGDEVRADEKQGEKLGIRGVPFYVVNRKYGISGAQPSQVFLDVLEKAWSEKHSQAE